MRLDILTTFFGKRHFDFNVCLKLEMHRHTYAENLWFLLFSITWKIWIFSQPGRNTKQNHKIIIDKNIFHQSYYKLDKNGYKIHTAQLFLEVGEEKEKKVFIFGVIFEKGSKLMISTRCLFYKWDARIVYTGAHNKISKQKQKLSWALARTHTHSNWYQNLNESVLQSS